jgi:hypothetical protein
MNRTLLSSLVAAAASLAIGAAAIASLPTPAQADVNPAEAHRDVLSFAVQFRPFPENFVDLGEPGPAHSPCHSTARHADVDEESPPGSPHANPTQAIPDRSGPSIIPRGEREQL